MDPTKHRSVWLSIRQNKTLSTVVLTVTRPTTPETSPALPAFPSWNGVVNGKMPGLLSSRKPLQSKHLPVLLCGVSNYPRLYHLPRAQHPPVFHLCIPPPRPRASHQSQAIPPDDHHAQLVPLRRSPRFPPHPPHHALPLHLNKSSSRPPPTHSPCLRRFPLQRTVKRHATTSCQQSPSKPLEKELQTVSP